MSHKKTSFIY